MNDSSHANYNQKITFSNEEILEFPDFSLQFLGTRNSKINLPLGPILDFQIISETGKQIISWSSGTGDISPSFFKTGRRKYFWLELDYSNKLGKLAPKELVIYLDENLLPNYKKPIKFQKGKILEFPDFDLIFIENEEREFPYSEIWKTTKSRNEETVKILVHNFEVIKDGEKQKITYFPHKQPLKFYIPWGKTKRPAKLEISLSYNINEDGTPVNLNSDELVITLYPALPT